MIWTDQHARAQKLLLQEALTGGSLTVLTGEVGCGKTMHLQLLLQNPEIQTQCQTVLISNRVGSAQELLHHVLKAFGDPIPPASDDDVLSVVADRIAKVSAKGQAPLLIVDEAHTLAEEAALLLAQLAERASTQSPPLSIILAGQPELAALVNRPGMAPLRSAIGHQLKLGPLSKDQLSEFIHGRLKVAGLSEAAVFDPSAINVIHRYSGGTPRLVNKACELCLFSAAQQEVQRIDAQFVTNVLAQFAPPGGASVPTGKAPQKAPEPDTPPPEAAAAEDSQADDSFLAMLIQQEDKSLASLLEADVQKPGADKNTKTAREKPDAPALAEPARSKDKDPAETEPQNISTAPAARRATFARPRLAAGLALCAAVPVGLWFVHGDALQTRGVLAVAALAPPAADVAADVAAPEPQPPAPQTPEVTPEQVLSE
ncbi:MAG: AAA family ATPase, partial [Pseudomonadota bacterium]